MGGTRASRGELAAAEMDLDVGKIESKSLTKEELREVIEGLGLSVGAPLHLRELDKRIRVVHQKGRYRDIQVWAHGEKRAGSNELVLDIEGARVRRISEVKFVEVAPEILEGSGIQKELAIGRRADPQVFAVVRDRLKRELEAKGYYFSDVQIAFKSGPSDDETAVEVTVRAGSPTLVDKVSFSGVDRDMARALDTVVPIKAGAPLEKSALDASVVAIQNYLRANQYPTSKVEETGVSFSPDKLKGTITFSLRMGSRYQFEFSGNSAFDDVALRDLMTEEMLSQSDAANKIALAIEEKYRSIGFNFIQVQPEIVNLAKDRVTLVHLKIDEGRRVLIDSVEFDGIWDDEIGSSTALFFQDSPGVLQRHIFWEAGLAEAGDRFIGKLQRKGYLSATMTGPRIVFSADKKGVRLFYDLQLGTQYRISKIQFTGNSQIANKSLIEKLPFAMGDAANRDLMMDGVRTLSKYYQSQGFIDVEVKLEENQTGISVGERKTGLELTYSITEGKPYYVGSISLEGNNRTKEKVILREVLLKKGDRFNPEKMRQSEDNIQLLGLFSRVEIVPASSTENPQEKNLKVLISEVKPGFGEVGFGGLYEDPLFRLRAFLGLGYRNLFGTNQTASMRTEVSLPISRTNELIPFIEYAAILGYRAPYVLDFPFTFAMQVGLDSFQVESSADGTEAQIQTRARLEERLEKKLTSKLTGQYRLHHLERTLTRTLNLGSNSAVTTSDHIDVIGSTGPSLILDLRNDIYNPTAGSYHSLDVEFAHPYLLSNDGLSFIMAIQKDSFYFDLGNSFGFAIYTGLGWAHAILDQPLPLARLTNELALGGQGTIRGYSPKVFYAPLGVRDVAFYNVRSEFTVPFSGNLSGAVFFDTGQLYPALAPQQRNDGVGVGIRYKTPVGPVVVDIAHGLSETEESKIKFSFTVGTI